MIDSPHPKLCGAAKAVLGCLAVHAFAVVRAGFFKFGLTRWILPSLCFLLRVRFLVLAVVFVQSVAEVSRIGRWGSSVCYGLAYT